MCNDPRRRGSFVQCVVLLLKEFFLSPRPQQTRGSPRESIRQRGAGVGECAPQLPLCSEGLKKSFTGNADTEQMRGFGDSSKGTARSHWGTVLGSQLHTEVTSHFLSGCFLTPSPCSGDHLPNKLLAPGFLSQGVWGETCTGSGEEGFSEEVAF